MLTQGQTCIKQTSYIAQSVANIPSTYFYSLNLNYMWTCERSQLSFPMGGH